MVTDKAHSIPFSDPPLETLAHFRSIPWCAALFDSPTLQTIVTLTRIPKSSSSDALIAETFATNRTIKAWQTFWQPPSPDCRLGQVISILTVGDGLSGHAHTLHGGFLSLLLDEIMNYIAAAYLTPGMSAFTAYIKVVFKKPIPTPGTILTRAWMEEKSGRRKLFLRGTVEDGQGDVCATGESLLIEVKKPLAKL